MTFIDIGTEESPHFVNVDHIVSVWPGFGEKTWIRLVNDRDHLVDMSLEDFVARAGIAIT